MAYNLKAIFITVPGIATVYIYITFGKRVFVLLLRRVKVTIERRTVTNILHTV